VTPLNFENDSGKEGLFLEDTFSFRQHFTRNIENFLGFFSWIFFVSFCEEIFNID